MCFQLGAEALGLQLSAILRLEVPRDVRRGRSRLWQLPQHLTSSSLQARAEMVVTSLLAPLHVLRQLLELEQKRLETLTAIETLRFDEQSFQFFFPGRTFS